LRGARSGPRTTRGTYSDERDGDPTKLESRSRPIAISRKSILSGALEPGGAIDKLALCERLGVSRFPVSSAINRLAYERLVTIEPQHGSFVAKISVDDVRERLLVVRPGAGIGNRRPGGFVHGRAKARRPWSAICVISRLRSTRATWRDFIVSDVDFHRCSLRN